MTNATPILDIKKADRRPACPYFIEEPPHGVSTYSKYRRRWDPENANLREVGRKGTEVPNEKPSRSLASNVFDSMTAPPPLTIDEMSTRLERSLLGARHCLPHQRSTRRVSEHELRRRR